MPQTIDDVVYYLFGGAPVVDEDGNPAENLTGGVVSLPGETDPLTVLDGVTLAPTTTITTGPLSFVSAHYVPIPDGLALFVTVDWPDDNIPPQEWYADPSEYVAASPAALAALSDAATQAAISAEAARVAAENAAIGALTDQERATLALLAGLDPDTADDGDVITWDADNSQLILSQTTVSADAITTGTLAIQRLPAGVPVIVSKSEGNYSDPDEWPVTRPGDTDHPVIWEGDREGTDGPGTIMLGGPDFRWFTE